MDFGRKGRASIEVLKLLATRASNREIAERLMGPALFVNAG
jgi:hypothetical protein